MNTDNKILVTGATGMVGSVLVKVLNDSGYTNLLHPSRKELNLQSSSEVDRYFETHKPEFVFMIAARVGGIGANISDPVGFLEQNLEIQMNLFKACHRYKTKKNLFLGSSCIYPRDAQQPIREEYLMTGPLEPTNEAYALAKIVGLSMAKYYHKQHKMITICPMPSNIYGTNDHFELDKSHVLSALVRKFIDAVEENQGEITLWGTGIARREFIHVEDVAKSLVYLMNSNYESPDIVNVGTGSDISIKELAELIQQKTGFVGKLSWDSSKPDGMLRKCMNSAKLNKIGYFPSISLDKGIERTIDEYRILKRSGALQ